MALSKLFWVGEALIGRGVLNVQIYQEIYRKFPGLEK